MKILITGGAGFVGYHVAKQILQSTNHSLVIIDDLNDYYSPQLKNDRLKDLETCINTDSFMKRVTFLCTDITEKHKLKDIFILNEIDIVIHLAAQAGIQASEKNPDIYIKTNIIGFDNIISLAAESKVKLFMYASSSSVYGAQRTTPFKESFVCDAPLSIYAYTKKCNELEAAYYSNPKMLKTIGLRFFNVYGSWGRPDMAYYKWADLLTKNAVVDLNGEGQMLRDMTYVDDVSEAILRLIDWGLESELTDNKAIFNIGNRSPVKNGELLEILSQNLGKKPIINFVKKGLNEANETYADTSLLKSAINFEPNTKLEDGLRQFIDWYRSYHK